MKSERELEVAINAAQAAAEVLQSLAGKASISHKMVTQNLVTEADIEAERLITEIIGRTFPNHQILGEEGGEAGGDNSDSLWVVDPLDGTNNYAHGIPQYSVSIAYYRHGMPQVGVVLDPNRNELFHAVIGAGAFLNGQRIATSSASTLADSIAATGFHYDRGELVTKTLSAIQKLFDADIQGIRRLGSAAIDLAWVACGRLEGYFEYKLSPWDYAAGALLVTESGGECLDRDGNSILLKSGGAIATNGKVTKDFLTCVRW
jgi:myo-inositol-1(or 4)-monophosphatase